MRKTVLFAAALFTTAAIAQTGEITSNRGENYLSQDGDWGLTISADPILNYAGNLFNGNTNNGTNTTGPWWSSNTTWDPYDLNGDGETRGGFGYGETYAVIGIKKLIDANTAYRGKVRLGFGSHKETVLVDDVTSDDPADMVEDATKTGGMNIVIGAGLEKRVGSTRVVGVYGAQIEIGIASLKDTYEYGNDINDVGGSRSTEYKYGGAFMVGLNAFGGIEWFFAPKMSLGAEYTWGLSMESKGFDEESFEYADGVDGPGSQEGGTKVNDFGIDTNQNGVSFAMNFYFQ
jgi:hypothetical protein